MIEIEKYKAGEKRQGIDYKYFIPNLISKDWVWADAKINKLIESTYYELEQLNSYAELVPNIAETVE